MSVPFNVMNYDSVDDHINYLETMNGYLEKANGNNLGDFTAAGKTVNAGYNNYTVYWSWYKALGYGNLQTEPYCAGFISTTLASSFGLATAKKLLCGDLFVYCPDGWNRFNNKGRIYTTPKKGDVVFFWSDSLKRWGHVGFVVGVDANGKGYTTEEANTSSGNDTVVRNGGATCRKHYTLGQRKVAFGRPDYAAVGISIDEKRPPFTSYSIGTGDKGLILTANINLRNDPGTSGTKVISVLNKGSKFVPTQKTFINGDPWIYSDELKGWISAKYVEGWMREFTCHDKWWYVEPGYKYPVNQIKEIDGSHYYFDAAGYMFNGKIVLVTDEYGALKMDSEIAADEEEK